MSNNVMTATLNTSVIQMNSRSDKKSNVDQAMSLIDQAAGSGAQLVALPEIWTCMSDPSEFRDAAEPIPGPLTDVLAERARRHGIFLHAGSIHEIRPDEPKLFNSTVVFDPNGDIIATYSKIHMFDVMLDDQDPFKESATATPGNEIVTFDIGDHRVGLAICYDLRFPELFRILALRGCDVIILPAAFTMQTGRDHWEVLIRARAIENQVYMVAPNQFGQYTPGKSSYGRSLIVDPWGTPLATAPDGVGIINAQLDFSRLRDIRRQIPSLANRMPDRYVWPEQEVAVH